MSAAADSSARAAARVSVVASLGFIAFVAVPLLVGWLGDREGVMNAMPLVVAAGIVAIIAPSAPDHARWSTLSHPGTVGRDSIRSQSPVRAAIRNVAPLHCRGCAPAELQCELVVATSATSTLMGSFGSFRTDASGAGCRHERQIP